MSLVDNAVILHRRRQFTEPGLGHSTNQGRQFSCAILNRALRRFGRCSLGTSAQSNGATHDQSDHAITRSRATERSEPADSRAQKTAAPQHCANPPPAIYALKPWTVKPVANGKWMIATTPAFNGQQQWKGPYQSLDNAAKAIARAITQEVAERHNRRIDFYGDKA